MVSLCRLELEWGRGRIFDMDIAQMFQRLVADAKHLKVSLSCRPTLADMLDGHCSFALAAWLTPTS